METLFTVDADYHKKDKVLTFSYVKQYPDSILVKSSVTGRIIKFVKDEEAAEQNEFWDGELYEYVEAEPSTGVRVVLSPSKW